MTTETLGMTVEKVICDLSGLGSRSLAHRASQELEDRVSTQVRAACRELPPIRRWVGSEAGPRGGQSRSAVDFEFVDGGTLSVKTTRSKNGKVCPPECGQPSKKTFDRCFGHLYTGSITPQKFKRLCLTRFHEMVPIYLKHLFTADYLLWLWCTDDEVGYRVIPRQAVRARRWSRDDFTFTRTLQTWKESCTVKCLHGGQKLTFGEFQLHQHRSSYKFRFVLRTLCRLLID